MIVKGHRVYRGAQGAGSWLPGVLLFILVFLFLACVREGGLPWSPSAAGDRWVALPRVAPA